MKNTGLLNPLALQSRILARAKKQKADGRKTTLVKILDSVGEIAFETAQASYLRSETTLQSNLSQYSFNIIKATDNSDLTVEQKLDRNDVFITDTFGLFIYQPDVATPGKRAQYSLQSYVNTDANGPFANMTTANIINLRALYAGNLNIKISQTEIISALDTRRFQAYPITQQGEVSAAATPIPASGASAVTPYRWDQSSQDVEDGFAQISPAIVFSGQGSNIITLNIPTFSGIDFAASTGYANVVVFQPYGLLLKNVASRFI